ncbi:hypothetical protein SAJA_02380 [Salinisphaera japonica YTM-1]|uniref:Uncharacterized protein n=1 Tax=Salinisphaera japonica YTM-1 TaxID=1209778 RepID=A0A423Q0Q6_9GAMM|nr:hypothetical protein SAJA_02380 [Salinisphaera japonica YTM-1]
MAYLQAGLVTHLAITEDTDERVSHFWISRRLPSGKWPLIYAILMV